MRPRLARFAVAIALLGSACDARTPPPRDLALAPAATATAPATIARPPGDPAYCAQIWPARVAVRGQLRREVHPGPPGYGETPLQDRRDTIVVLILPAPLAVCVDSVDRPGRPAFRTVDRLQLTRSVPRVVSGALVTVFGTLTPAAWGWHHTPVILEVDSIPALAPPRGGDGERTS